MNCSQSWIPLQFNFFFSSEITEPALCKMLCVYVRQTMGTSDQTLPLLADQRVSFYWSPSFQIHHENMLREIVCFRSQILYWTSHLWPNTKACPLNPTFNFIIIFFIKGIVHPKNKNSTIIYTPASCSKPEWFFFSAEHKGRYFKDWQ